MLATNRHQNSRLRKSNSVIPKDEDKSSSINSEIDTTHTTEQSVSEENELTEGKKSGSRYCTSNAAELVTKISFQPTKL